MLSYCLEDPVWSWSPPFTDYRLLPDDSVVFAVTGSTDWSKIPTYLEQVPYVSTKYVFVEAASDPWEITDTEINAILQPFRQKFINARCIFLSASCKHFYSTDPNIVWYPKHLLINYDVPVPQTRNKRIGCLNRRNSAHRVWLMYNLLEQALIDHERDIFSVCFRNIADNGQLDINAWMPGAKIDLDKYPAQIATMPDNIQEFNPNISEHPAWHTAITIVTETKVNQYSQLTEKTFKAMMSDCCWISYSAQSNLDVLQDLGFETSTFDQHATGHDIDPILKVCQELDTESAAMDYYHSKQPVIAHNKQWLLNNQWQDRYMPKLNSIL